MTLPPCLWIDQHKASSVSSGEQIRWCIGNVLQQCQQGCHYGSQRRVCRRNDHSPRASRSVVSSPTTSSSSAVIMTPNSAPAFFPSGSAGQGTLEIQPRVSGVPANSLAQRKQNGRRELQADSRGAMLGESQVGAAAAGISSGEHACSGATASQSNVAAILCRNRL
jgi:hypothetical protein